MARASAASRQNHLHPAAPVMTYLPVWLSVSPAIGHLSPWPSSSAAHQFNPAPAPAVSTLRCGMIPPYHFAGFWLRSLGFWGMVQTQVTAQGWLGSTPEGRRPQIR